MIIINDLLIDVTKVSCAQIRESWKDGLFYVCIYFDDDSNICTNSTSYNECFAVLTSIFNEIKSLKEN